jgi:hypothetical protein
MSNPLAMFGDLAPREPSQEIIFSGKRLPPAIDTDQLLP